jgi:hypothetical protein
LIIQAFVPGATANEANQQLAVSEQPKASEVTLIGLEVSEKNVEITVGNSITVKVTAMYSNGTTEDVTKKSKWFSSKQSVAAVSSGTITAKKEGKATIKAQFSTKGVTKSASIQVTVKKEETSDLAEEVKKLKKQVDELLRQIAEKEEEIKKLKEELKNGGESSDGFITWDNFETENVKFHYTPGGNRFRYIAEDAEAIIEDEEKYFGSPLPKKVDAFIHGDDSYLATHRQANYDAGRNNLVINAQDLSRGGRQDVRYHFAHEMAHAYTEFVFGINKLHESLDWQGHWLTEGIAEYVAKHKVNFPKRDDAGELKKLGYGKEEYIKVLREMKQINWKDIESWQDTTGYNQYFVFESIVYYLETEFGHEAFFEFCRTLAEGKSLEESCKRAFGKSEEQLVNGWKSYFELQ